jgi:hypothetical protein
VARIQTEDTTQGHEQLTEWVVVNGARIERLFFEANLQEAKNCTWDKQSHSADEHNHNHCLICNVESKTGGDEGWFSDYRWICDPCHKAFIEGHEAR